MRKVILITLMGITIICASKAQNQVELYQEGASSVLQFQGDKLEIKESTNSLITVDQVGRVGIGTTTPSAKLDVNGTIHATSFVGDGSQLINLPANSSFWTQNSGSVVYDGDIQGHSFSLGGSTVLSQEIVSTGDMPINIASQSTIVFADPNVRNSDFYNSSYQSTFAQADAEDFTANLVLEIELNTPQEISKIEIQEAFFSEGFTLEVKDDITSSWEVLSCLSCEESIENLFNYYFNNIGFVSHIRLTALDVFQSDIDLGVYFQELLIFNNPQSIIESSNNLDLSGNALINGYVSAEAFVGDGSRLVNLPSQPDIWHSDSSGVKYHGNVSVRNLKFGDKSPFSLTSNYSGPIVNNIQDFAILEVLDERVLRVSDQGSDLILPDGDYNGIYQMIFDQPYYVAEIRQSAFDASNNVSTLSSCEIELLKNGIWQQSVMFDVGGTLIFEVDDIIEGYRIKDASLDVFFGASRMYFGPIVINGKIPYNHLSMEVNTIFSENIGIGTTNTGGFALAVEGKIGAREIEVTLASPFPDYVFEEDYDLSTLEETEAFIKENKHLPEIPSAEEVEANGLALGEMNTLLLKKIEELTLHLINQNYKLGDLIERVEDLETENDLLKSDR
ncbi:MAG: hypothetical protein AAF363_20130 [Bacteroidota bacterium]